MENEEIEIKLLTEAIKLKYGYDFSGYANSSFTRRVKKFMSEIDVDKVSEIIPQILYDNDMMKSFIFTLSVNVTTMFRDPNFFKALRKKVIPYLRSFPHIKIWSAGVSTGEEVYSLAIILKEEGLYDKTTIYATDFNDLVLNIAKKGIYTLDQIKVNTQNYQKSGGKESFSDYYYADNDNAIMNRSLKDNIVFANHNLVTDGVFGEMNLILCRNVLIYFNRDLQNHVLTLFEKSLRPKGFFCMGEKESINFTSVEKSFDLVVRKGKIYQKKLFSE